MPQNIQRFLPMIVIFAALIFILPLLNKKKSSGPSTSTKATSTLQAMDSVGKAEAQYLAAHGRYSSHVADLVGLTPALATALGGGVTVSLDVSTDGKTYYAQAASDSLSLTSARSGAKTLASSCLSLKSGANCPVTAVK